MKLSEIDKNLYEFTLKDLIKGVNLGRSVKKLGVDGLKKSALTWLANKKIPDELEKAADRAAQKKRQKRAQKRRSVGSNSQYKL